MSIDSEDHSKLLLTDFMAFLTWRPFVLAVHFSNDRAEFIQNPSQAFWNAACTTLAWQQPIWRPLKGAKEREHSFNFPSYSSVCLNQFRNPPNACQFYFIIHCSRLAVVLHQSWFHDNMQYYVCFFNRNIATVYTHQPSGPQMNPGDIIWS